MYNPQKTNKQPRSTNKKTIKNITASSLPKGLFSTATSAPSRGEWKICKGEEAAVPTVGLSQQNWLVVSTHLKNISQNGNLPQAGMKN